MKTFSFLPALAAVSLLAAGCAKDSGATAQAPQPGATTTLASEQHSLVGFWKSSTGEESGATEPMAKMGSMLELHFPTESNFRLLVMGMPVEGDVARSGHDLTLTPRTFVGLTFEEARSDPSLKGAGDFDQMERPMKGSVSADGTVITLKPDGDEPEPLVFKREIDEPVEPVVEKVTPTEKKFVGKWAGTVEIVGRESLSADDKKQATMAEAAMKGASITLRADNTFEMRLMFELGGTWKHSGSELVLTPTKMIGMEGGNISGDPMKLKISPDGRRLTAEDESGSPMKMHFERA